MQSYTEKWALRLYQIFLGVLLGTRLTGEYIKTLDILRREVEVNIESRRETKLTVSRGAENCENLLEAGWHTNFPPF